jgi:hypothetical protein
VEYAVPAHAAITLPHSLHLYDERYNGVAFSAFARAEIGKSFIFRIAAGKRVDIAPAVEIAEISPSLLVLTPGTKSGHRSGRSERQLNRPYSFKVQLINHTDAPVKVKLDDSTGGAAAVINLAAQESKTVTEFPLSSYFWKDRHSPPNEITLTVKGSGQTEALTTRSVPVVYADARVDGSLLVGYVRGFDYSLPNALAALGVASKELSVDEIKRSDLQKYSAVIVDNRVYESKPELIAANPKLLDYAKAGGTLIVFYHKSNEWNPDERRNRPQLAPYKLILGDERITDETAPITFIEPQHPLLNLPNKLGQEDFANWIQERGLYYPKEWDANYHALLQSNDPGEAPLKGGLLVADYGSGHYIYTSMVWYRELRAGVPGAYRMLANMISYGKTKP